MSTPIDLGTIQASVAIDLSNLRTARNEARGQFAGLAKDAQDGAKKASDAVESVEKSVDKLSKAQAWGTLGRAAGDTSQAVTRALMSVGRASFDAASNLNEALSKSNTVFKQNGREIEKWADGAAGAFGQSKREALESASTFGNLFTAMKIGEGTASTMSKTLVQLSSDLASFNNVDIGEAMQALRSGLVGETEPLRRFGVNLNEATLKAQALKMGLISSTKEAMEPSTKAAAAYALILEQTKTAQGDFARTADGAANKQRILKAEFENAAASLGQELLPAGKKLLDQTTQIVRAFNGLAPETKQGMVAFVAVGGGFLAVAGGVATLITRVAELKLALATLSVPKWLLGVAGVAGVTAAGAVGIGALIKGTIHYENESRDNEQRDAALPGFMQASQELSDERDNLATLQRRRKIYGPGGRGPELDRQIEASQARIEQLEATYKSQYTRFGKDEKANGKPAPPKATPTGGGLKFDPQTTKEDAEDAKRKAEQEAKRLADSMKRARDIRAGAAVDVIQQSYDDLLAGFQDGQRTMKESRIAAVSAELKRLSGLIAAAQRKQAGVALNDADRLDKPAAQAEYDAAVDQKTGSISRASQERDRAVERAIAQERQRREEERKRKADEAYRDQVKAENERNDRERQKNETWAASVRGGGQDTLQNVRGGMESGRISLDEARQTAEAQMRIWAEGTDEFLQWEALKTQIVRDQVRLREQAEKQSMDALGNLLENMAREDATLGQDEVKRDKERLKQQERERDAALRREEQRVRSYTSTFASAFEDVFSGGRIEGVFEGIGQSFKRMLIRMAADAAAADLSRLVFGSKGSKDPGLGDIFKGGAGGGGGDKAAQVGQILSAVVSLGSIGKIFGGFRAGGGPVTAGVPYVVGEQRPELFVPRVSGTILPYVPGRASGGPVTVNIHGPIYAGQGGNAEQVAREIGALARAQMRVQPTTAGAVGA